MLNNSRIHGLAAKGATTFRNAGWTVTGTGNYRGRLPADDGLLQPRPQGGRRDAGPAVPDGHGCRCPGRPACPATSLTVVLTRYFKP